MYFMRLVHCDFEMYVFALSSQDCWGRNFRGVFCCGICRACVGHIKFANRRGKGSGWTSIKSVGLQRAIINGVEYQSSLYKRTTARNNFTVIFKDRGKSHYGSVLKFLKC